MRAISDGFIFLALGLSATGCNESIRNPHKQPFTSESIWNMPIGSEAIFVPANLSDHPGANGGDPWAPMPGSDAEHIILRPNAPLVDTYYSDVG